MTSRYCKVFFQLLFITLFILIFDNKANAQQIVLNPVLNQTLITFQQQFPEFLQQNPELSMGLSPDINLSGGKGKVKFNFQQQGQYLIVYDSLQFSPTNPISQDRFQITLKINSISFMGNASLMIAAKGKNFDLQCQNNLFMVNNITFTSLVDVVGMSQQLINPQVNFDPKTITATVPCLQKGSNAEIAEINSLDEIIPELTREITDSISSSAVILMEQSNQPSSGILKKVNSSLQSSVTQSNSTVSSSATSTSMTNSMTVASRASSPCGATVSNDVRLVIADLASIASQAEANGFRVAIEEFTNVLKSILPTLSKPSQDLVQKFIDDLTVAIADGQISTIEQITLSTDLYNVIISTGITSSQLTLITDSLANVLSTLSGISTTQLKADLQKLVIDAQACIN